MLLPRALPGLGCSPSRPPTTLWESPATCQTSPPAQLGAQLAASISPGTPEGAHLQVAAAQPPSWCRGERRAVPAELCPPYRGHCLSLCLWTPENKKLQLRKTLKRKMAGEEETWAGGLGSCSCVVIFLWSSFPCSFLFAFTVGT